MRCSLAEKGKTMFNVRDKDSEEIFTVYAVSSTMFLIYDRMYIGGNWIWTPMERYEPVEG